MGLLYQVKPALPAVAFDFVKALPSRYFKSLASSCVRLYNASNNCSEFRVERMTLDFLQVQNQIIQFAESAPLRDRALRKARQEALVQLQRHAQDADSLYQKVQKIARFHDPNLRCAIPALQIAPDCPLDASLPLPDLPAQATILAADGSQILPSRHEPVSYSLINVGAICMQLNSPQPPLSSVASKLIYDEELYTDSGVITEARLALLRDLNERKLLAELVEKTAPPAVTFTDGPMELWGAKESELESEFSKSLDEYLEVLERLQQAGAATAGYVDKPAANLVTRLLEIAMLPDDQQTEIRKWKPLQGVKDADLFRGLLGPGERSCAFGIQSRSAGHYRGGLALHFFYINVGQPEHPWISRVEIPAWVGGDHQMLDSLHAVLIDQCRILGNLPYPYLLHRAHETAVVTLEEKEQVTQMILQELRRHGVQPGEGSFKQAIKNVGGRRSFSPRRL